jgi:hypothetical protein
MTRNPFRKSSTNEKPLERELCQRLHYEALVRAARGGHAEVVPTTIDLSLLRQRAKLLGGEVYLYPPEAIESLFAEISIDVYRKIVELYCSRLERSIDTVWKITQALAHEAGRADIPYEAVWALCMHLEEHRRHETETSVEREATTWWISSLSCDEAGQSEARTNCQRSIVCLLDLTRETVLAFRVVDIFYIGNAYGLVVYDALVAQRRPGRDAAAGLIWLVPERLIVEHEPSQDYREGCARLGIRLETEPASPAFFHMLQAGFQREVSSRRLRVDRWAEMFDSYLHKVHKYSPIRSREERDREYIRLVGYNRDPAWQCPALRHFLPLQRGSITHDGAVPYDGLHYADELLEYWAGAPVTFRRSEHMEALIWVYLDGNLLSQAMARELQRRDGSYRLHRPGR